MDYTFVAYGCARWFFGHLLAAPTEYDFVGGIFDAALVEYRPKSPKIACFRACGAPWDADSGWSRAPWDGKFLPKVVVFGV